MSKQIVTFRMESHKISALKAEAHAAKRTVTSCLHEAIDDWLKRRIKAR